MIPKWRLFTANSSTLVLSTVGYIIKSRKISSNSSCEHYLRRHKISPNRKLTLEKKPASVFKPRQNSADEFVHPYIQTLTQKLRKTKTEGNGTLCHKKQLDAIYLYLYNS